MQNPLVVRPTKKAAQRIKSAIEQPFQIAELAQGFSPELLGPARNGPAGFRNRARKKGCFQASERNFKDAQNSVIKILNGGKKY
uniref:hypothetical protein n=1 Tax=Candidatus Electronema sp. TaxID=2698783 RepID=UPI004056D767